MTQVKYVLCETHNGKPTEFILGKDSTPVEPDMVDCSGDYDVEDILTFNTYESAQLVRRLYINGFDVHLGLTVIFLGDFPHICWGWVDSDKKRLEQMSKSHIGT